MTKYLSRDVILGSSDIQVEELEVPEWGGSVLVRELTTAEVENFSIRTSNAQGQLDITRMSGLRAEVVSWALVDEEGNQLLHKKDAEALQKKSHQVIDRIFNEVLVMSGLKEPEQDEEGEGGEKKV
jgi:hypothetical protein